MFWRIRGSTRAFCLLDNLLCAGIAAAARLLCPGPDTRLEIRWPQFGKGLSCLNARWLRHNNKNLASPERRVEKIEGFFVYPLNCASVSITFAKVIPPDPLPEEVGERFEFSWIVPKDRPWKVGDRLAIKFFEFGELLQ